MYRLLLLHLPEGTCSKCLWQILFGTGPFELLILLCAPTGFQQPAKKDGESSSETTDVIETFIFSGSKPEKS